MGYCHSTGQLHQLYGRTRFARRLPLEQVFGLGLIVGDHLLQSLHLGLEYGHFVQHHPTRGSSGGRDNTTGPCKTRTSEAKRNSFFGLVNLPWRQYQTGQGRASEALLLIRIGRLSGHLPPDLHHRPMQGRPYRRFAIARHQAPGHYSVPAEPDLDTEIVPEPQGRAFRPALNRHRRVGIQILAEVAPTVQGFTWEQTRSHPVGFAVIARGHPENALHFFPRHPFLDAPVGGVLGHRLLSAARRADLSGVHDQRGVWTLRRFGPLCLRGSRKRPAHQVPRLAAHEVDWAGTREHFFGHNAARH
jgi:hypothetical protein